MALRILFIFCCLWSIHTPAVEVTDLYQSELYVTDKSRDTRVEASKKALYNVIKKLTGRHEGGDSTLIKQAMRSISDYMLKYEYLDAQDGTVKIRVKFEPTKVEELVRDAQLPLWGNRRPLIAIWLAIEDNFRREFVTQDSYPQLERLIYDTAAEWGVPVIVPLLDLDDLAKVSVAEVWGNFSEPVELASQRYNAERAITARMFQQRNSSSWQLEWRYTDAQMFEVNKLVGDKQQILITMVNDFSSALAKNYAIDPNVSLATQTTSLIVDNLKTFTSIELAKRQLTSLSTVVDVDVVYRSADVVRFEIQHSSTLDDLVKSLNLEQAFNIYVDPHAFYQIANASNLRYSWVGQ
ncbi:MULTISPECIES: DUF2066 domain-containing protein [Pseudoalteromonas]|uniref:DUF2066 domain-containing protein n=1 Tax=Pseudoalteromonas amylolytica TaxID=1859457 RepID=A0A1S1MQB2_9GAMM|nr:MULTISPECIES: DUF2066 domain-containing protein [Pseudoalteromonas]MCF6435742.1 DUF2066 domain-containing protein [Pseudoalteromonas sp. MMG022]OHU86561.1 hypothetical protein BFC16_13695 [Pseudoalteromonas sp. JW3]OHU88914.1 hypothetical protein BET10_19060 [Pseudoalteromonas amylolytica]